MDTELVRQPTNKPNPLPPAVEHTVARTDPSNGQASSAQTRPTGSAAEAPVPSLHFNVSTGLKRVIGRDLITDDEVAIFELVKNAFDANATKVLLRFQADTIWVVDNGDGMSYTDVAEKWLFVAYSTKRDQESQTFREQISARRHYAGSKGIGRFSSDRLGKRLLMQTRPSTERPGGPVHQITVDWDSFEADETKEFGSVPVKYSSLPRFELPSDLGGEPYGTALKIGPVRATWDRTRILHLKASLAKLINPFGARIDDFKIEIVAPDELRNDQAQLAKASSNPDEEVEPAAKRDQVNGEVGNFIFSTLRDKTTFIEVVLSKDGRYLDTTLTDRGELVFRIREPNPFETLAKSGFSCALFYLNQSAKVTFARRMGIPSVRFGSVFLFRNGFRVFPIGEDGDDWFGMDARKQQGYARFLGTRDVIGRIDVSGSADEFKEASSRDQGLITTPATEDLKRAFREYCLKRLERYVVPVSWIDPGEKVSEDISRLLTDAGRARVAAAVALLIDSPDVQLLEYSRNLIRLLNERSDQFEKSIASLRAIAVKTRDKELAANLDRAERRFEELRTAEAAARRIAEDERTAKEEAQAQARRAQAIADATSQSLEEERKRTLFLASITSLDTQTIVNMHHQITIYAADLKQQIENCMAAVTSGDTSETDLMSRLEQIAFLNQKVLSIARLATKANFRLESDTIEEDLGDYIEQYVRDGAAPFAGNGIELRVEHAGGPFVRRFRPMEVAIIIDNLISNARKARATRITFSLSSLAKGTMTMEVYDNGRGLPADTETQERIFDLGVSRTNGSGLGLYHVRQVLGEMGGAISIRPCDAGAHFIVRFTS